MSPQRNAGEKAFVAGEALTRGKRVKISSNTVVFADAGEEGIGTTTHKVDSGDHVNVHLDRPSIEVEASGAIAQGGDCYAAADGDVSATISGRRQGIALEAGTDGNLFEMMPAGVNS